MTVLRIYRNKLLNELFEYTALLRPYHVRHINCDNDIKYLIHNSPLE